MNAPNTRTIHSYSLAIAAIGLALACGTPPESDSLDKYICPGDGGPCVLQPQNGVIQGGVVYQGVRRGDAVLLLFASNSLPPPDGTATAPVEIERIPSATLFGGAAAGSTGPFSAPYLFTEVPPGSYQIRAFLDITGDFDPFADFTQSPRAGAPTGGTVTFDAKGNATLTSFPVAANQVVQEQVVIGQEVPYDPPAFQLAPGSPTSFPTNIDRPQELVLQTFNPNVPHANFSAPKFSLQLHPDANGNAQESDGDGLLDIYPQVTLLQTQALQADGSSLPVSGAAAAIVPCKVLPISTWPIFVANPGALLGLDQITILIEPLAVQINAAGQTVPLPSIPAGEYELVVAERTGQIWTLPNSLGEQTPSSGFYVASQGVALSFSATLAPGGAISGVVTYPADAIPGNLIIQAFKGGPQLAPPLAAQLPARVLSVPKQFITLNSNHQLAYTLAGLPPGTYVVEALDDEDGNFNNIDILQTPTRGDLVGGILDQNGNLAVITVGAAAITGEDVTLIGKPGQNGQGAGTPLDPPAFVLDESNGIAQIAQDARGTVRVEVQAQPDVFPALNQNPQTTFFTVALVRDGAGNVVDSDGDGLPDVWPRAFLIEIDPADPQGLALATPNIALPVAVDPTPYLPWLLANPGMTLPETRLSLIVRPTAVDLTNPAAPVRLPFMPAGKYKLILMNQTGQLWQLPNSSGTAALDPAAAALVNTASQSRAFAVIPPAQPVPPGGISGTLALSGVTSFHSAYIFAYSTANPPPPQGTGKPVSVDFHSAAEFTTAGGVTSVAYSLPGLPGGSYLVTVVVDTRGDFAVDPFLFAAAPGPGDFVGGDINTTTFALSPVLVTDHVVTGISALVFGAAAQALPARPSFVLTEDMTPVTSDISTLFPDALTPQRITLSAQTELNSGVVAIDPETGPAFFPVEYQGCNAAGEPVDADFDNLPDLYPRILVARLADSDSSGLTIDPADIVIPADIDPTAYIGQLGACSLATVLPETSLSVILQPIAVQPQADGSLLQMPIPAGRYGIILESKSGQVWRLPNELQPALLDPQSAATAAGAMLATQGVGIRVASQVPAALGGGIAGAVSLNDETQTSIGNLIIAAYSAEAPPPPLGLGRPVAVQVIPAPYVKQAVSVNSPVSYLLGNMPPGAYIVLAFNDAADQFSPSLDYLSTPPFDAQLSFAGGAQPTPIEVGNTLVQAPAIQLYDASADTIPFPRPAFEPVPVSGSSLTLSGSTSGSMAIVELIPFDPAGVPYMQPPTAAFYPTLALNAQGQPYYDPNPNAHACTPGGPLPWASSQVYATPIDTGSPAVAGVFVDSCQFCQSLTGTPDCTAAPLVPPNGPLPMTTPIIAVVTNIPFNPLTQQPLAGNLPPGHYALTLIEQDGQSWTVPNALATADATQAVVITVAP